MQLSDDTPGGKFAREHGVAIDYGFSIQMPDGKVTRFDDGGGRYTVSLDGTEGMHGKGELRKRVSHRVSLTAARTTATSLPFSMFFSRGRFGKPWGRLAQVEATHVNPERKHSKRVHKF